MVSFLGNPLKRGTPPTHKTTHRKTTVNRLGRQLGRSETKTQRVTAAAAPLLLYGPRCLSFAGSDERAVPPSDWTTPGASRGTLPPPTFGGRRTSSHTPFLRIHAGRQRRRSKPNPVPSAASDHCTDRRHELELSPLTEDALQRRRRCRIRRQDGVAAFLERSQQLHRFRRSSHVRTVAIGARAQSASRASAGHPSIQAHKGPTAVRIAPNAQDAPSAFRSV